jgi:hypothetical protein
MEDDSKPLQAEQETPPATTPAEPPVVHQLAAGNYSVGALDFAAPALSTPVTPLCAQAYELGALDFGTPIAERGRRFEAKVVWGPVGGRPRKIPDALKPGWIAAVEAHAVEDLAKRSTTDSGALFQTSTTIVNFAQGLAKDAGVMVSDCVLIRQVIKPAIKRAKTKALNKN